MRVLRIVMHICLLLYMVLTVGCNSTNGKEQIPSTKPKDFNFVFNYGVGAKNQIDTLKGQYTKDMVMDPSVTTTLKLSDEEMDTIYCARGTLWLYMD